jgi:prepilin-type N-terminal cleavage/methylation domain-containing protein
MALEPRRQKRGFTSVEILIVLAILVILAACCLSAFSGVREMGRQSVCTSNLRQIGVSYTLYTHDFERRPPQLETLNASYLKSPHLLLCPSDPWLHIAGDAGTNARQNKDANASQCPALLHPLTYYYSGTTCDDKSPVDAESYWDALNKGMGSSTGIAACRDHGTRQNNWEASRVQGSAYEGKVLRLQLDGAVVTRQYSLIGSGNDRYLDAWSLFSDKPHNSD